MNPRARKKEPPDPLFSLFDLPIPSSSLVDLAMSLLIHRLPCPDIPFPCPFLDFVLSSVSMFCQIGSPPQPIVGVQSTTRRFRSRPSSAALRRNYWAGGPRAAIGGRCYQDWRISPISCASVCPASLRPAQVCANLPSYLLLL